MAQTVAPPGEVETPNKVELIRQLKRWFVKSKLPIWLGHRVPEAEVAFEDGSWFLFSMTRDGDSFRRGAVLLSAKEKDAFIAALENHRWNFGPRPPDDEARPASVRCTGVSLLTALTQDKETAWASCFNAIEAAVVEVFAEAPLAARGTVRVGVTISAAGPVASLSGDDIPAATLEALTARMASLSAPAVESEVRFTMSFEVASSAP